MVHWVNRHSHLKNPNFVALRCSWVCFYVIIHLYYEASSYRFCSIWLNLSRKYSSVYIRNYPAVLFIVRSSINTSDPVPLTAIHVPDHLVWQMMWYAWGHELSFSFPYSFLSIILGHVNLGNICLKNPVTEVGRVSSKLKSGLSGLKCYQWFAF